MYEKSTNIVTFDKRMLIECDKTSWESSLFCVLCFVLFVTLFSTYYTGYMVRLSALMLFRLDKLFNPALEKII